MSGQLQKIHVNIGDEVKEGDLLVEIDPRIYETRVSALPTKAWRIAFNEPAGDNNSDFFFIDNPYIVATTSSTSQAEVKCQVLSYKNPLHDLI